uniref:Cytochrome P450 n=1 Tax=Steinernema glaseri TaxID=37863 RepID=A0A1I7XYA9_9BILA
MIPCCVLLVVFLALFWWIRSTKRKDLPPGPTPLPFLGNAHQLFWAFLNGRSHVDVYVEWKKKYGNVYTMYVGPFHIVIIADYKTTMEAFVRNGEHHAARPPFYMFNTVRNDRGVTFAKGPGWQEQRRFSLRTLRDFGFGRNIMQLRILEEFHYRTEQLDRLLEEKGGKPMVLDPRHFMDLLISSIINRILVGYRYDEVSSEPEALITDLQTLRDFGFGRNIMQLRILEEFHYRTEQLDRLLEEKGGKPMVLDPRHFMDLLISSIINRILVGYRYDESNALPTELSWHI